jgi:uncharacterized OB-fold protein
MLEPQSTAVPAPYPSVVSAPYWDGLRRHELLFQRCAACNGITHTPAPICAHCLGEDLAWEQSAGTGTIYSWTMVWRPQTPAFEVPYCPVIVDVDEGWQILSNLIGIDTDQVDARFQAGLRVQVEFHPIADGFVLPYFRPVNGG